MYQKKTLQQLQQSSAEDILAYKSVAEARKQELEELKAKSGKSWTPELQNELDEIVVLLVDIEELIEVPKSSEKETKDTGPVYTPAKGTEKMVHLSIVRGRRFNPNTGKEESRPYIQLFTFSEWQIFKKHFRSLGYSIMAVLHDPYNEAGALVAVK